MLPKCSMHSRQELNETAHMYVTMRWQHLEQIGVKIASEAG